MRRVLFIFIIISFIGIYVPARIEAFPRRLSENGIFEKMGVKNKQLTTQKFTKKLFSIDH